MPAITASPQLLEDLRAIITRTRGQVAGAFNQGLVLMNWQLGSRIRVDILGNERADYGREIVATLSRQLTTEFGRGFTKAALHRMVQFAERFSDPEIVATLSRQLSWSHFVELIPIGDPLKRDFYIEMCRRERWNVRTTRDRIQSMLFERTAISRKPEELVRQELDNLRNEDRFTPELVFRDPYLLDFLGLAATFSEQDLETAILKELERFILELGTDFSFLARQKRIVVGGRDRYIDLLFFHRGLRRLIAVELKLGEFQPERKGQVELYLRWLDRHERRKGEDSPLGLILCAGSNQEEVELLQLDQAGIHVAEYLTQLPPREILEGKLRAAVALARAGLQPRMLTTSEE